VDNTNGSPATNSPIANPRDNWWIRLVRYAKRKRDEREAKKKKESPTDRAARITATSTIWIAVFTVVLAVVGGITLFEVMEGGSDTHDLAQAAKTQSQQAIAQTTKMGEAIAKQDAMIAQTTAQAQATNQLVNQMKRSADIAKEQQAAWVGIENPTTMPVTFKYLWPKPAPYASVDIDLAFSVRNYGSSPAYLMPLGNLSLVPASAGRIPDQPVLKDTCGVGLYRTRGQVTFQGDVGEMILPGASKPFNYGEVTSFGVNTPKQLTGFSFTVCLVYQDAGGKWRYSGYRYFTWGGQPTPVPNHDGWFYSPINSAFLQASKAE
jgi:hypothetical protein